MCFRTLTFEGFGKCKRDDKMMKEAVGLGRRQAVHCRCRARLLHRPSRFQIHCQSLF